MKKKPCEFCGQLFKPAPRRWRHQTVCYKAACRKKGKAKAQRKWLRKNPGHFRRHYDHVKKHWDYTSYLRNYRANNPQYVAEDNRARRKRRYREKLRKAEIARWQQSQMSADIQDLVLRREKAVFAIQSRRGADIQDTVRLQLDGILELMGSGTGADIQELVACTMGGYLR